jgi:hypothetical protein
LNQEGLKTFIVENTGDAGSILTGSVTPPNLPFIVSTGLGSFSLRKGERFTVEVRFKPTTKGSYTDGLAVNSNDPNSPSTPIGLLGEVVERIKVWMNAFIPQTIPGLTFNPLRGPYTNFTVIPAPLSWNPGIQNDFLTDQRFFSSDVEASARMHSELELDIDSLVGFRDFHRTSMTTAIDHVSGELACERLAFNDRMHFVPLSITPELIQVELNGRANNRCARFSPDIIYFGTITIDMRARTVSFVGQVSQFPAFEMYVALNNERGKFLYHRSPDQGASAFDLLYPTVDAIGSTTFGDSLITNDAFLPTGTNVTTQADIAVVTFANVTRAGSLNVTPIDPISAGPLPNGYALLGPAYDITTTSTYSGPITACFNIPNSASERTFSRFRVLHGEGGGLIDRTSSKNISSKTVCATVNTLSPFIIAATNSPPEAKGKSVTVAVSSSCATASVNPSDVDNGSFDPDGDNVMLTLDPSGPYNVGNHPVTLTISDNYGARSTINSTISVVDQPPQETPVLISEETSTRAIALESTVSLRDPFQSDSPVPWGPDRRTRLMLFAMNFNFLSGENSSIVTADAEDASHNMYPLTVEYVGKVPGYDWLNSVIVRLNDNMGDIGDVLIRLTVRGVPSNRVRVGVGHTGGGPPDDLGAVPTPGCHP